MFKRTYLCTLAKVITVLAVAAFFAGQAKATPYASSVTNNNGTIQFYLNESNAVIVVTHEDGSTNSAFDGVLTGTNELKGLKSFSLGAHTSYKIAVSKNGSGLASILSTFSVAASRGVDVNHVKNSPYFGQIYMAVSTLANTNGSLRRHYSDMSLINTNSAGVSWVASSGSSPYRLAVNDDSWLTVGDFASAHSGVWRVAPDLSTNQLLLGPPGDTAGSAANSHGSEFSRPLLIGNLQAGGNAVLYTVDAGNFAFNATALNSILVYSNINLATMPRTTAPDLLGPETGLNQVLNNNYPGITVGPNGYFYLSNRRDSPGKANVQVYDQNLTLLWDSVTATGNGSDFFIINGQGLADGAVSPDGNYFGGVGISDNHISICSLTNGIPDISTLHTIVNSNTATQARGFCWDAADNVYVSSSGVGGIQQWSLGLTATTITYGNATGQTNFTISQPATKVSVTATVPAASQSGPTPGVFTITRSSVNSADTNSPLTVFYTLTGTATNGTYTVSGGTASSVTLAAGINTTNITITPVNDGLSRPTTTVILTIAGNGNYAGAAPVSDTVYIQNIGTQYVFISSAPGSTMYKGLTNDYGSFVLTRWGDTNAASFTVSNFTYSGVAVSNVQFTPAQPVTFNPGDIFVTNASIFPLIDTTSYVGNKPFTVGLNPGTVYAAGTNKVVITIIDNANLPATVLYANPLTDPADAANWGVTSANNNMHTNGIDNTIEFGYDLTAANGESANNGLISLPPSGATSCLRVTVNKSVGSAAGVNLYPTNVTFSGDYAFRFAMNVPEGNSPAYTTEGPLFGINHTGTATNWWSGSALQSGWDPDGTNLTWTSDGVWYSMMVDGGAAAGDYIEKTGVGGTNGNAGWQTLATASHTSFVNVFKNPSPYSVLNGTTPVAGIPANISPYNAAILGNFYTNAWVNVEIKTVKNKVTLSMNGTSIFTYTNTTVWTNGLIMLGYLDPFNSVGGADAAVYYSDIKVVRLATPLITLQPTNVIAAVGAVTNFSVAASFDSSSANTNGQWSLNGTPIAGATNNTYSFTVAPASYGTYAWTVNDGNYTVVSTNVTLRPPLFTITTNPVASLTTLSTSLVVAAGISTNLYSAANSFSGNTNYQWQLNSNNIPFATNRTYSFTSGPTNYGTFRVLINDNWNFATSSVATVTPPLPSIISVLPATRAVVPGLTASTFTVTASTFSGLTNYQWLSNSVSIPAAVGKTLIITNVQPGNLGSIYTVRVSDGTTLITNPTPVTLTLAVSPSLTGPALRGGTNFALSFGTEVGPSYVVDSKTNLLQPTWLPLSTNAGTGGAISVTNTVSGGQGYFRIRLQ
ncbi:MAG: hypothetical protein P4N60_09075 [Verrucomicrobiae bacterium]|nr:hypothetical protein [Verrucomicrobiae bacterium]